MKYRLKKWYPSLPKSWEEGDIVHQSYSPHCYSVKNKNVDYRINVPKEEVENNPEFWEEVIEKDYEILKVRSKNGLIYTTEDNIYLGLKSHEILSVKRLSDGEVFTVGDEVTVVERNPQVIKGFELKGDFIRFRFTDDFGALLKYFSNPKDIQHAKQPIFTAEDGVDIYEGDEFWFVRYKCEIPLNPLYTPIKGGKEGLVFKYEPEFDKYFSTKEKAQEWIDLNEPRYSKNDVKDLLYRISDTCSIDINNCLKYIEK